MASRVSEHPILKQVFKTTKYLREQASRLFRWQALLPSPVLQSLDRHRA